MSKDPAIPPAREPPIHQINHKVSMEAGLSPKNRVSFTDFPPEIRNIIYRLTLVSNESLGIQALHPDEYQQQLGDGSCHARTAFRLAADPRRKYRFGVATGCFETTYSLHRTIHGLVPSLAMLSLNDQTRREATSIFYGLNTFSFTDMDCIKPFMLDRTAAVVKIIESFRLEFSLSHLKCLFCRHTPISGCDTWIQAASDLAQFDDLHLKRLIVDVEGQCNDLHIADGTFILESPTTRWIPALLGSINGLDMLGINYACSTCNCNESPISDAYLEVVHHAEEDLWNILAPHMLRKDSDDHDGITLQHRRILGIQAHRIKIMRRMKKLRTSTASESGSEPDIEENGEDEEEGKDDDDDDENEDEEEKEESNEAEGGRESSEG